MRRRPPRSTRTDTLFPYTTLFRSLHQCFVLGLQHDQRRVAAITAQPRHEAVEALDRGITDDARQPVLRTVIGERYFIGAGDEAGTKVDKFQDSAQVIGAACISRSEERTVGKECVRKCSSLWALLPYTTKHNKTILN